MTEYVERETVLNILASKNAPWDWYQKVSELPSADVQPMKWIPVTEKLPARFGVVIVCGKMKDSFEKDYYKFVDVACFDKPEEEKDIDKWSTFNDWYEGQQEYAITHWMPLPEPPKEE